MKRTAAWALVFVFFLLPTALSAQSAAPTVTVKNPLSVNTIEDLLVSLLDVLIMLAIPVIVTYIIYVGFLYVTAQGNATKITEAHNRAKWIAIGALMILGAKVVAEILKNTVAELR